MWRSDEIIFVFVSSEVQYNVRVLALANKYPSALNCLSGIKYRTTIRLQFLAQLPNLLGKLFLVAFSD